MGGGRWTVNYTLEVGNCTLQSSESLQLISTATPFPLSSNCRPLQAWPGAQRGGKRQQRALLSGAADAGARGSPDPGAAGLEAGAAAAGPRAGGLIDLRRALGTTTPVQQAGLRAPRDHHLAVDLLRCEWICGDSAENRPGADLLP